MTCAHSAKYLSCHPDDTIECAHCGQEWMPLNPVNKSDAPKKECKCHNEKGVCWAGFVDVCTCKCHKPDSPKQDCPKDWYGGEIRQDNPLDSKEINWYSKDAIDERMNALIDGLQCLALRTKPICKEVSDLDWIEELRKKFL